MIIPGGRVGASGSRAQRLSENELSSRRPSPLSARADGTNAQSARPGVLLGRYGAITSGPTATALRPEAPREGDGATGAGGRATRWRLGMIVRERGGAVVQSEPGHGPVSPGPGLPGTSRCGVAVRRGPGHGPAGLSLGSLAAERWGVVVGRGPGHGLVSPRSGLPDRDLCGPDLQWAPVTSAKFDSPETVVIAIETHPRPRDDACERTSLVSSCIPLTAPGWPVF